MRDCVFWLDPQEDITAYELAQILIMQHPLCHWIDCSEEFLQIAYPKVLRHLRKGKRGGISQSMTSATAEITKR